ncbi:hypothetical protein DdX_15100 [Ditylenchus destructor]|uniref:Uncharacterized protein n=1 Tax=Ditylenchus destructor TaxID=166010 RepID=A0AAD4R1B3_9BILA|nr:hypothetical protein DdX_15100 [Ditylenchus destructor]
MSDSEGNALSKAVLAIIQTVSGSTMQTFNYFGQRFSSWILVRLKNMILYRCAICGKRSATYCQTLQLKGLPNMTHKWRVCRNCCNCEDPMD